MDKAHFAPGHDRSDRDLHEGPPTPSQSGRSGSSIGAEIGSREEERAALGGDPEITRPTKSDKLQPRMTTRADHDGGSR